MTVGGVCEVGTLAMDSCSTLRCTQRHGGSGWVRWALCRVWVGSGIGSRKGSRLGQRAVSTGQG